jgi:hypothetical protein
VAAIKMNKKKIHRALSLSTLTRGAQWRHNELLVRNKLVENEMGYLFLGKK